MSIEILLALNVLVQVGRLYFDWKRYRRDQ